MDYLNWIANALVETTPAGEETDDDDLSAVTCMTDDEARVTFARYTNEHVVWGRCKGLKYGNMLGAGPEQKANLYPDKSSTYFVANICLPPECTLVVKGTYPHARYVSFTVANQLGDGQIGNGNFLRGDMIVPDAGSQNPFLPENSRDVTRRNFTIYVKPGYPPRNADEIPPNTLYSKTDWNRDHAGPKTLDYEKTRLHFSMRTYLADKGYDGTGNILLHETDVTAYSRGLPQVSLQLPDGSVVSGPQLIKELRVRKEGDPNGYREDHWLLKVRRSANPNRAPSLLVPFAEVFWNTDYSVTGAFLACDPRERVRRHPPSDAGGFASNPDTKYMVIIYALDKEQCLVVRGKKPSHPYTRRGQTSLPEHCECQYFSVSTAAAPPSGEGYDTACDEQIPVDSDGNYTIVVSWPWYRPKNANLKNGVVWLSPGDGEGHYVGARNWVGILYIRYQNPSLSWIHSPARIPMPTIDSPLPKDAVVMGPYYPRGQYMTTKQFEMQ